jgi:hypothetical protein
MGKMKELFMKINYPFGDYDLEREYLVDDSIAESHNHEEYLKLQQLNKPENTKIEVSHGTTTRIEVNQKNLSSNKQAEITGSGLQ